MLFYKSSQGLRYVITKPVDQLFASYSLKASLSFFYNALCPIRHRHSVHLGPGCSSTEQGSHPDKNPPRAAASINGSYFT